jgi:hypothetical protein
MNPNNPFLSAGLASLLALVIAASASAADIRSPDTREANVARSAVLDQRSPDTREADPIRASADLRSPDTKDVANSGAAVSHRLDALEQARASSSAGGQPVFVDAPGLNWSSAAIGAAAAFGLMLVLVGTATVLRPRRVHPT